MGIDGFSMSNLGLNRNLTSAQLAHEAELTANQALDNQLANVDGVGKKEKAGRKDPDAAFNGTVPFIAGEKEEDEEDENKEESAEEQNEDDTIEDNNDSNEENENESENGDIVTYREDCQYSFKLNENGLIEVWDLDENKVVRTISPEDAAKTMLNSVKAPSIFVNKYI